MSIPDPDAGLQPERTALAWRRTGLSLGIGALLGIRIFPELVGAWIVLPAGLGLLLAIATLLTSQLRYRDHHIRLTREQDELVGPVPMILMAAATVSLGVTALGLVLWHTLAVR
jgi:uncharacterized membrane protein YidH (DUF202 family)